MDALTALIVFSGFGAVICAKSRAAGPAVFFAVFALALLSATPAGAGLAELVGDLVEYSDQAAASSGSGSR